MRIARSRCALWKNPEDLTRNQQAQLEWIAETDPRLHRAYLLKEGLRYVFAVKGQEGKEALDRWLSWARRSRMQSFVELAQKIVKNREAIDHNLDSGLSNGLIESTNTNIRLLTRIAFGFRGPEPLIAVALVVCTARVSVRGIDTAGNRRSNAGSSWYGRACCRR